MTTGRDLPKSGNDWSSIEAWRKATRKDLIARRTGVPATERRKAEHAIFKRIRSAIPEPGEQVVGFYWPIKGEVDLRPLLQDLLKLDAQAALPVVVEKNQPLEFWEWHRETRMSRGTWRIPIPGSRKPVQPTVLLIPLLGFDATGHRLGYGGGYYDRTLAAFRLMPMTIGVGYSFGRLSTIYPQAHDIPLDAVVTEVDCTHFDHNQKRRAGASSPPCYLHEFDGD